MSVTKTVKRTYAVVVERAPNNYAAYAPDVLGCASVGDDWPEMMAMIREGLGFHIEGMLEHGEEFPEPTMSIYDAMRSHLDLIDEPGYELLDEVEDCPPTEVTITLVEVEIELPASVSLEEPTSAGD